MRDFQEVGAVVLAAGVGKRFKSRIPKPLHTFLGRPLLLHALGIVAPLELRSTVIVVSPPVQVALQSSALLADRDVSLAIQDPPRGTADALRVGVEALGEGSVEHVLVTPCDAPLLTSETLERLVGSHLDSGAAATLLTAELIDPTGFGRVIRDGDAISRIVEESDADAEQKRITEVNAGSYVFELERLRAVLGKVDHENAQDEYYLTDVVALLRANGDSVMAVMGAEDEVFGVNDRSQLADAAERKRREICERWMSEGVTIVHPESTFIDQTVQIGRDTVIQPFTFLQGDTTIGEGVQIGPQAQIIDSQIDDGARISFAVVRGSSIGPDASVGPFASLRPGTRLERGARVGTFVETKQTTIGENSKANHLSYLGDAEIGRAVNVGAGTITCNWDGVNKHKTVIEDEAYISSDTMLVAPVRIGKKAATGAGAVVKGDVPDGALAVGVPARVIEGKGDRMRERPEDKASEPPDDTAQ
ncbi:MAG TPA: bifunctional UDP-N-acetylglucosamine diphosphorylase/glucosamine-1-phosphate N-acetyltransferase GlmU [Actinomycetota bacterium]|nr:bifunctional UDP-N-acetylglucosamine diphosphorylase/glucosamine-1-phosphate N-acetyltransferase GlmU [Actinomycetota bacterium]